MKLKTIASIVAAVALAVLAGVSAAPGKSQSGKAKTEQQSSKGKAKGHAKAKNAVFTGKVVSVDAAAGSLVVTVEKANRWGRRFKGQDVTFTTAGVKKVNVADTNADGKSDLADVKPGDVVRVQAKITREAVSPLAARKLSDKTNPKPAEAGDAV